MSVKDRIIKCKKEHPSWGRTRIARELGVAKGSVFYWMKKLNLPAGEWITPKGMKTQVKSHTQPVNRPPEPSLKSDLGDKEGSLTSVGSKIRTQEDLIAAAGIDLKVWKVVRCVVNKWECVMKEPATTIGGRGEDAVLSDDGSGNKSTLWTRQSHTPLHEEMFQVKLFLERRTPAESAVSSLLAKLEAGAPLVEEIKRPAPVRKSGQGKRSLEICIMDPHIGLLCQAPEGDGPWDMDLAAGMIMAAIDDLIYKARTFGPFEEVFMPFGNDFVHSDTVFHTTTAGTTQPEAIDWHAVYDRAEQVALNMVERMRQVAPVKIYEVPGNHSRMADYTLARLLRAAYRQAKDVEVDASSSPYKFHRAGINLIGYEHGHSVAPIRLAALMANERRQDWAETEYREWHLGDQHRKGSAKPSAMEEQGVSIEYIPGLTAPNSWHRIKAFSHQQRGAMAFVWDHKTGPLARFQFNVSHYDHLPLSGRTK